MLLFASGLNIGFCCQGIFLGGCALMAFNCSAASILFVSLEQEKGRLG
jgi:hypothetical protein